MAVKTPQTKYFNVFFLTTREEVISERNKNVSEV